MSVKEILSEENYLDSYYRFQDRQGGISLVFSPESDVYYYNVYCLESKLLKELMTVEFEYLEDALVLANEEFATWDLMSYDESKCSSCGNK